jgi:hypothetical protein
MDDKRPACLGRLLQPPPCLLWIIAGGQVRQASHAAGAAASAARWNQRRAWARLVSVSSTPQADHGIGVAEFGGPQPPAAGTGRVTVQPHSQAVAP